MLKIWDFILLLSRLFGINVYGRWDENTGKIIFNDAEPIHGDS